MPALDLPIGPVPSPDRVPNEPAHSPTASSSVARHFAALASGDAVARIVAFLAGVFVARELGAEMCGVMAFGQAVVLYASHLAACGVDLTGIREVAADSTNVRRLVPSLLAFRTLVAAGLFVVLCVGAALFLPPLEATVVALFAATLFGHGPNAKFALIGLGRPGPVALARSIGELLYAGLVFLFVREKLDVVWVPWAQAIGDVVWALLMLVWLRRLGHTLPLEIAWSRIKPLLSRSFPLVLNIVLGLLIFNCDLLVLKYLHGNASVGLYWAAYQLISFLINMAWAYSHSLLPALTQASPATGARQALYHTSLAQSFAVAAPVAVGGALLSSALIALVFGEQYAASAAPLAILVASVPFMLYKDVAMVALIVAGRENIVLRMTAIAVLFNLVGNLIVIPHYGMIGAACTTLATEVLRALLAAAYARESGFPLLPVRRMWKSALAVAAMAAALLAFGGAFPRASLELEHALAAVAAPLAVGVVSYALALGACGGIEWRRGRAPALRV